MRTVRIAPTEGDTRVREGFLLFPRTIAGERRWLVNTAWVETYLPVWCNGPDVVGYLFEDWVRTAWAGQSRVKRRHGETMSAWYGNFGPSYMVYVVVPEEGGYSVVSYDGDRVDRFGSLESLLERYEWIESLPEKGPYPPCLEYAGL